MDAKTRLKEKIILHLSSLENDFVPVAEISADVFGYKDPKQIHKMFNTAEMGAIEAQALELRRKRYVSLLAAVDLGLLKKAASGDTSAAKLAYQRFEGWMEKSGPKNGVAPDLGAAIQKAWESIYAGKEPGNE